MFLSWPLEKTWQVAPPIFSSLLLRLRCHLLLLTIQSSQPGFLLPSVPPVPPASQLLPDLINANDTSAMAVSGSTRHPTHRLVHTYTVTTEHKLPAHSCTWIPSVTCAGHTHYEASQDLTQLCWVAVQGAWRVFLFWEEEMGVTVTDCSADPGLASPCSLHEPPLPREPRAVAPGRKVGQDMGTAEGPPGGCQGLAPRLIWSGSTAKLFPAPHPTEGQWDSKTSQREWLFVSHSQALGDHRAHRSGDGSSQEAFRNIVQEKKQEWGVCGK